MKRATRSPSHRARAFRAGCRFAALLAAPLFVGHAALAQIAEPPTPPAAARPASELPPGPPPAGAPSECFPACREGYVCHQRQCISLCNPACPSGQTCVAGRRCEFAAAPVSAGIREPPLPPPVKPFADRGFFMLGFHYGFSGEVEVDPIANPLASTFGFNLRGDVPIERYLLLGPLFQFGAWRGDVSPAPSRSYYVDADLYIRARLPVTIKSTSFQLWAGVPIGLTFNMLGPESPGVSGAGLGWNFGFLAGGALHFTPNLGLFTEIGWLQHKVTHDAEPDNMYLRLAQWNLNVGLVFRE